MEICNRCNGKGYIKDDDKHIRFCESCGGHGTNDWIGNAMGKTVRKSVVDILRNLLDVFRYELADNITLQKINNMLNEFLVQNPQLMYKLEAEFSADRHTITWRIIKKENNNEI